jgi:hypothetical protein
MRLQFFRSALAMAFVLACSGPAPSGSAPSVIASTAFDPEFVLTIATPRGRYAADEPIAISASLTYIGALPLAEASGSGSGLVGFAVTQVDGRLHMEPAWRASCAPYSFHHGETKAIPFAKSGGTWDENPDAEFWRHYFSEPELRLPRGQWRLSAVADFWTPDGCTGRRHQLRAEIDVAVE